MSNSYELNKDNCRKKFVTKKKHQETKKKVNKTVKKKKVSDAAKKRECKAKQSL